MAESPILINKLRLSNYRNYTSAEFDFAKSINCITGENGIGKTNVLDAIHYLCLTKGFLNSADKQNIKLGENYFSIEGSFLRQQKTETILCSLKNGNKKIFKRNKKELTKLSKHIGFLPLVLISPQDQVLIYGGGEERRKFTDRLISQYNKSYLFSLVRYNKLLAQRNALLKKQVETRSKNAKTLEIFDTQLAKEGETITSVRQEFVTHFTPRFTQYYQQLSNNKEQAGLMLKPSYNHDKPLIEQLKNQHEKDYFLMYTSIGPHRDDLQFTLNGTAIKKVASQGQQKTYLCALKLAEYQHLKSINGVQPILLLDDVFEKLDMQRVTVLIKKVNSQNFGQVFITDTENKKLKTIFAKHKISGNFIELSNAKMATQ